MAKRRRTRKTSGSRKQPPRRTTGAPGPAAGSARAAADGPAASPWWQVLLGLASAGVLLTAYLTLSHWMSAELPYCGQDSPCDVVQSSRWSIFLGLPLTLWGLLTYAVLARLIWRARWRPRAWRHALFVACIGAAISFYLTAVSLFEINATCAYCLASTALITAICVLLAVRKPSRLPGFRWRSWAPATAFAAAMVVAGMHLHYSGVFDPSAGPEKPYLKALAIHLQETGAKFYGAYWCPRCVEQKGLFEASADRLPYVECAPGGPDGLRAITCTDLQIDNYPTWIIDGRRYVGKLEPEEVARYSGFRWDEQTALAR